MCIQIVIKSILIGTNLLLCDTIKQAKVWRGRGRGTYVVRKMRNHKIKKEQRTIFSLR